jgi:cysteine desulfurase/selenocysteine lyase
MAFDVQKIRADFPILSTQARGKPLVYFDNAATTLKPRPVVDAVSNHYLYGAANIHRGVHYLSEEATKSYEGVREKVRAFINAKDAAEVIITSGTTASINLVALSFGQLLQVGDEIVITEMEHHSNIVPWQMLCERRGTKLKVAPIDDSGDLKLDELEKLLTPKTKLLSLAAISNSLGTINPYEQIIQMAKAKGVLILLDAAQTVAHVSIDVQALGVDFLAFSSHKLFGPTGVGILYGRRELLEKMPPVFGGGDMIRSVTFEKTTYADLPARLEAGTPGIASMIGLGAAIDYVKAVGLPNIYAQEQKLLEYGTRRLGDIKELQIVGTAKKKTSIISFTLGDIHPHDIGSILDQEGVAIRAGHHCTQPLMKRMGVVATARASMAFYNTTAEIDVLAEAIQKVVRMFA